MGNPSQASTINWKAIQANILREARQALDMALDQAEKDAKEYAPVRDVFLGGRGRAGLKPSQEDDPSDRRGSARVGSPALLAERGKRVIRKSLAEQASFLKMVKSQRAPKHRYNIIETTELGDVTGRTRSVVANSRSFNPVVVDYQGVPRGAGPVKTRNPLFGKFREGNLRNVTGIAITDRVVNLPQPSVRNPAYQRAHSALDARGRPEILQPATDRRDRPEAVRHESIEDLLSYRGRNELKRLVKIANRGQNPLVGEGNAATFTAKSGETLLGGRLRDEIHRTPIRQTDKSMSGWVVSPTPYAKFQEYGTSRHRAQPYMRPALYQARMKLPRLLKQHMERKWR